MDRDEMRKLDEYRLNEAGPLENDLVDELAGGDMDRQDLTRPARWRTIWSTSSQAATWTVRISSGAPLCWGSR